MKLTALHEEFLDKARRPMTFGALPVGPKHAEVPIVVVNKWSKEKDSLVKTYVFQSQDMRNSFVKQVLDHEVEVGHNSVMTVTEDEVTLRLQTKDIKKITELDKEFAKWADELYRDTVYSRQHDRYQR